jgi:hypothetical protein
LVQSHRDATDLNHLPLLAPQSQALLVNPSCVTATLRLPLAQQLALHVAVLAQHEGAAAVQDGREQTQGAEVAIRHPHIARANQRIDLVQQGSFLGVAVLGQQHVCDRHLLLVEDRQGDARQRGGPRRAQFLQAMLRCRQMIAVEELDAVAGQQRGQRSPQGADDGRNTLGGVTDQRGRDGEFDVLELVVDGLIADRELVFEFAVGGMDRRLLAEDDTRHQVHE